MAMHCPVCLRGDQSWTVSKGARRDGAIRRRQECRRCRVRWTTAEVLVAGPTPLPALAQVADDQPHCSRCLQWQGGTHPCGLGFPEAHWQEDFAAECLHYQPPDAGAAAA